MSEYQLFDALTPDEYKTLKDSIAERGVLVPVEVDENNVILDGHHRVQAWEELKTEGHSIAAYPVMIRPGMTEAEKRNHVRVLNLARRQLSKAARKKVMADMSADGMSNRAIAEAAGVSEATARRSKSGASFDAPDKVVGKDGKTYPAKQPKVSTPGVVATKGKKEQEKTTAAMRQFGLEIDGMMTAQDVDKKAKEAKKQEPKQATPATEPAERAPRLIVGRAEQIDLADESVDLIITSPPYNLGRDQWPMGGNGRTPRDGIEYSEHDDTMPESEYQSWQQRVLIELYRVAKQGASLFYNHKVRIKDGVAIHPLEWIYGTPWTLRQEIIWDRGSTHNHSAAIFWPEDERVYWLTKGKPTLPDHSIGMSTVWRFHGPVADTWHPAPFSEELPERIMQAIGREGITVLDPFAGSCTTLKVALANGCEAVGVDVSSEYLERAAIENGWT